MCSNKKKEKGGEKGKILKGEDMRTADQSVPNPPSPMRSRSTYLRFTTRPNDHDSNWPVIQQIEKKIHEDGTLSWCTRIHTCTRTHTHAHIHTYIHACRLHISTTIGMLLLLVEEKESYNTAKETYIASKKTFIAAKESLNCRQTAL